MGSCLGPRLGLQLFLADFSGGVSPLTPLSKSCYALSLFVLGLSLEAVRMAIMGGTGVAVPCNISGLTDGCGKSHLEGDNAVCAAFSHGIHGGGFGSHVGVRMLFSGPHPCCCCFLIRVSNCWCLCQEVPVSVLLWSYGRRALAVRTRGY